MTGREVLMELRRQIMAEELPSAALAVASESTVERMFAPYEHGCFVQRAGCLAGVKCLGEEGLPYDATRTTPHYVMALAEATSIGPFFWTIGAKLNDCLSNTELLAHVEEELAKFDVPDVGRTVEARLESELELELVR